MSNGVLDNGLGTWFAMAFILAGGPRNLLLLLPAAALPVRPPAARMRTGS